MTPYVLVVDADPEGREQCHAIAAHHGRSAVPAAGEPELQAVIGERGPPELVIFGWSFPRRQAFHLLELLRKNQPDAHLPGIVVDTFGCTRAEAPARLDAALARLLRATPAPVSAPATNVRRAIDPVNAVIDELDIGVLIADEQGRVRHLGRTLADWIGTSSLPDYESWLTLLRGRVRDAEGTLAQMKAQDRFELELAGSPPRVLRGTRRPIVLPDFSGTIESYINITGERELRDLARIDALTGLLNRRGGQEMLLREAARVDRDGSPLGLALFDIDHFKRINDTCGHATGDDVLRLIARVIDSSIRAGDAAARWGGEEVLALLPGANLEGARAFAERVRTVVEAVVVERLGHVTLSAGVAQLGAGEIPDEAVARADARLYEAKSSGRNCVR